jgi:hypothetical protein
MKEFAIMILFQLKIWAIFLTNRMTKCMISLFLPALDERIFKKMDKAAIRSMCCRQINKF